jgi:DNA-binding NarL/FixJ family response regulator
MRWQWEVIQAKGGKGGGPVTWHNGMRQLQERAIGELTSREQEVLVLLAAGWSTVEIADALRVSRLTARNHIIHIMRKLVGTVEVNAARFWHPSLR